MNIPEERKIPIRDLVDEYIDNDEEGVLGYHGNLNIRPKYQREFVYDVKQRDAVIDTVMKGFPLNVMYWADNEDGTYEVLDGQQRIVSICRYWQGRFSIKGDSDKDMYFHTLLEEEKEKFLDYKLVVYFCRGSDKDKLDWFQIINIRGESLTNQELRNAIYSGPWVTAAKKDFSKTNCAAHRLGGKYMKGSPIRQHYLESVIKWTSEGKIDDYMANHRPHDNADELWEYFEKVIEWVKNTFPEYRRDIMKGVEWGSLYNRFGGTALAPSELEGRIKAILKDEKEEIKNQKGIYEYVLTGDKRILGLRAFTKAERRTLYERQNGKCPGCGKKYDIQDMDADHVTPWVEGGATRLDNAQMLCQECNRRKGRK